MPAQPFCLTPTRMSRGSGSSSISLSLDTADGASDESVAPSEAPETHQ